MKTVSSLRLRQGTNFSSSAKWRRDALPCSLAEAEVHFARMTRQGFGAIRVPIFWEAIAPTERDIDHDYLSRVRALCEVAHRHALHVTLCMHQDLFGRAFGNAGAPVWSTLPADYLRYRARTPWQLTYFEPAVMRAFDRFWSSRDLQDAWIDAWVALASAVHDVPSVVALDAFNEPFSGSLDRAHFESKILPGFYARLQAALRKDHVHTPLAVEPSGVVALGGRSYLEGSYAFYSPHLYPLFTELGGPYISRIAKRTVTDILEEHLRVASSLSAKLVLGEFGVGVTVPGGADFVRDVRSFCDTNGIEAFQWEWSTRPGNTWLI